MALVKSIEEKIKINKIVSISAMVLSLVVALSVLFYSYKMVSDSRKSIYILDNGVPILVKQTDELLNRPVEYKAQVELFHRLFFTLAPDDKYIKNNIENKALYLIDDTGKKEYANLRERGFYNQVISSNTTVTVKTDSIKLDLDTKKFSFYGTQIINRKTSVIIRNLITEGHYENIVRTPQNPHGVLLRDWKILDNTEISKHYKYNF